MREAFKVQTPYGVVGNVDQDGVHIFATCGQLYTREAAEKVKDQAIAQGIRGTKIVPVEADDDTFFSPNLRNHEPEEGVLSKYELHIGAPCTSPLRCP